jgi:hypothetical protein
MKQTGWYILFVIFALGFFSCEKEIQFKGEVVEPKMVVNGFLSPDSTVMIHLSASRFFLSNEYDFRNINDAVVLLWKDGVIVEVLRSVGDGHYVGDYYPKVGDKLRIMATAPGFDDIDCETEIVPPPAIQAVDTLSTRFEVNDYWDGYGQEEVIGYYGYEGYDLTVRISDPPHVSNYYRLFLYIRNYYSDGNYYDEDVWFESDDLVFGSLSGDLFESEENRNDVFSDELFDGSEYRLKLNYEHYFSVDNSSWYEEEYPNPKLIRRELNVELQGLSRSLYLYLKSRSASENGDDLGGFFSEPVQIFSNVNGGIGVLGSYTRTIYKVELWINE